MGLPDDDEGAIDLTEGVREQLILDEPVYLVTSAHGAEQGPLELARYARHRWIAGCDRCRANLLRQCAQAGFIPKIAFTTDDYVAVQALVAADLGVSILPALCLRAARHPGVRTAPLAGARRHVFAVRYGDPPDPLAVSLLTDALRAAAEPARPARSALRGDVSWPRRLEAFLERPGHRPGEAELVGGPADDQAASVDTEGGSIFGPLHTNRGGGQGSVLYGQ